MGTNKPQQPIRFPEPSGERLDSWKEIAAYLKRDERTVRRWEAEGLPVHRKLHKKQASIYAYKAEIDNWWTDGRQRLEPASSTAPELQALRDGAPLFRSGRFWIPAICVAVLIAGMFVFNLAGIRNRALARGVPPIQSIAVLPLENLSGDPNQEYFVDGMTDALITALAKMRDVKVISRTSAMQYKGTRIPLREIARALDVDAVVEGSVVRSGGKVRITAQLIHAPGDRHLWADSFEGPANDILSIQDEVARAVADRIQGQLDFHPQRPLTSGKPVDLGAYEAYLRGIYFFDKRTSEASKKSVDYFRKAIAAAPKFGPAYAGLAEALPAMYWFNGQPPVDALPEAKAAAKHAIELDDRLAEAHTALGALLCLYDWNWHEAEKELKRALELNPNNSLAHERYMMWLLSTGRLSEAVLEAKRAQQLDPVSFFMNRELGHSLYVARRYDEALEQLRRSEELEPHTKGVVRNWIAWIYELQGKTKGSSRAGLITNGRRRNSTSRNQFTAESLHKRWLERLLDEMASVRPVRTSRFLRKRPCRSASGSRRQSVGVDGKVG